MTPGPLKIGIIAGSGELPGLVAHSLERAGKELYVAALEGVADQLPEDGGWSTAWYPVHKLERLLDGLAGSGVEGVVLAGKVPHKEIFRRGDFDATLKQLLLGLPDHRASTILGGIADLLESRGMKVLAIDAVVPDLMPPTGHLAGPALTPERIEDLRFGWSIARTVADQDIGQTVVVRDRSVVAVEAMEGTDAAIERAVHIAGGGFTVVKLAARDHDFRFDVPTVGTGTVARIAGGGPGTLAVESGRCTILGLEEVVDECNKASVSLISCREDESGEILWADG